MLLNNPKFENLQRMGKDTRWTPATVEIPTLTSKHLPAPHDTTIALYENQQPVFDEVKDYTSALVDFKTSGGKTVIAISLHQAWGGRSLIVCHSLQLSRQVLEEFEKFTDIKPTLVCGGKKDMTGDVVITTHTTFRQKYNQFPDFRNLIIDEADLMFTPKAINAIVQFNATRTLALTGTVNTPYDFVNDIEGGVLGKFYGKRVQGQFDESKNPLKGVYFTKYNKTYRHDKTNIHIGAHDWINFRATLDADVERKLAQLKYVIDNADTALVLFDKVADTVAFQRAFIKRGYRAYLSNGEMSKDDRETQLQEFHKNGGYLCAVASTVGRGYSHIPLDRIFILFPVKSENSVRQIFGRLMRWMEGKESYVYLWADSSLDFQFQKQKAIIKKYFDVPIKELC